jgi:hypothetical protein
MIEIMKHHLGVPLELHSLSIKRMLSSYHYMISLAKSHVVTQMLELSSNAAEITALTFNFIR